MTKKTPDYLKLHVDEVVEREQTAVLPAPFEPLCRAFSEATGWGLSYTDALGEPGAGWSALVEGGGGRPAGRLVLQPPIDAARERTNGDAPRASGRPLELEQVRPLALAIAGMLGEVSRLRQAIWEREAELAAGVPVAARPDEEAHLAERLACILKAGAESVGCSAAGLYLLDDATSSLKLRAAFGLPQERLLDPPRPLRGAVADLEALVGHAVVLEDTSILPHWRCPEPFPAALCVPVASPTTPLGTLWIFSRQCRDFTEDQTNLIEIVAGRIAADLEREMLLTESRQSRRRDRLFEDASNWQQDRLPSVTPLVDDWEFAGWTQQADALGGDFFDWCVLPDGRVAIAVADAHGRLLEAGLNAAALQGALKSHSLYSHDAAELLSRLGETLWMGSAGDQFASLAYGLICPASGHIELALAGSAAGIHVHCGGREVLTTKAPPLGTSPDARYQSQKLELAPGDVLVLLSEGARTAVDEGGLRIGEGAIATLVRKLSGESAREITSELRRLLDRGQSASGDDMTVLVTRRRGK